MGISWSFKSYLVKKHHIYTVTELQKKLVKKTGFVISIANLCRYVNGKPKRLDLKTIEIICTALDCEFTNFIKVTPSKKFKAAKRKKLSYKNTPKCKIGVKSFPNPDDYE